MAVSKIIYKASASATPETWMDVTQDTVTTSTLLSSYTATKNDGTKITGEYVGLSLQSKSATYTPTTSTQTSSILPDSGYALSSVGITVNPIPSAYIIPTGTLSISQNGSGIDVASYASVDVSVSGGGGGGAENDIIQGTLSGTYENSVVTSIGSYMFYSLSQLQSVSFANVTNIGATAFTHCTALSSAYFPNCKSIGISAFAQCSSLSSFQFSNAIRIYGSAFYSANLTGELNLPSAVLIGSYAFAYTLITTVSAPQISMNGASPTGELYGVDSYAFYSCSLLSSVYIPSLPTVAAALFYGCSALPSVSFPRAPTIGSSAFRGCFELQTVYCPSCSYIGPYAFASCSKLQSVSFPRLSVTLGSYAFNSCTSLSWALIGGSATGRITLSSYAFSGCSRLSSLYILCSSVASLVNVNVFSMTPISTYTTYTGGVRGSIFVPESLYSTYIASTNWVTYSSRFASLTSTEISALLGT